MEIPFMRIDRQFQEMRQELMPRIEELMVKGRVLQSPEIEALEKRLAAMHKAPYAVAVNSGTDALIFAVRALNLPPGSRIALGDISFIASASAIVLNGHIPVFVDVDPQTLLMDEKKVLSLIETRSVEALIAVDLYGQILPLENIYPRAKAAGIWVIEDAAQSLGATRHHEPPGVYCDIMCISFDPTKVIGAYGSGGAVVTRSSNLEGYVKKIRYHGHKGNRIYDMPGFNSQMDSIQAVIIDEKLNRMGAWQQRRSVIADQYDKAIAQAREWVRIKTLSGNIHNHHKYVFMTDRREELIKFLEVRGIKTSIHYSLALHTQPCFKEMDPTSCPVAENAVQKILSLPMYAELTDGEVDYVCKAIRDFSAGIAA